MALVLWRRRSRASLMRSTALQAAALAVLASPAAAQLAANARPGGGQVSAGQASIGGNASTTLITQKSQNAAINWQSYNVGSAQTVQYAQPNAASITLNRVVGPDPSQIAGKILANGQIIIVNQSGVVFEKGSQVDTAGLVVSSAGISDKNFMAGHLVFDQAGHAGAIVSNAGNITVRQAGLAALVAPQVANSGTITAQLGRVILGGAVTHTLDLYGDGLVALNITGQVTKASLGGQQVTALVTNTGTILAPGGTIVLSAAAVDGVVTNLVSAGGKMAAATQGGQTGHVLVQGIGGGIDIEGQVSATGVAAGTVGGQVVANATGAVNVGAGATVDASGDAGGGVVAIGTTAARAIGGASVHPTLVAQDVSIAAGARVQANATRKGKGGRIAVLSRNTTNAAGAISATGGQAGGDGGWIEVSGGKVGFGGTIDAGAAKGAPGSILIDPADIIIEASQIVTPGSNPFTVLTPDQFAAFQGNVILKADGQLTVASPVTANAKATSLELEGDQGITIDALLDASGLPVVLKSVTGPIAEGTGGSIIAGTLSAETGGAINLLGTNQIGHIGAFSNVGAGSLSGEVVTAPGGTLTIVSPAAADEIANSGLQSGGAIQLNNIAALTVDSGAPITASGGDADITVSGITGQGAAAAPNTLSVLSSITGDNVTLDVTGTVAHYAGAVFTQSAGTIQASGARSVSGQLNIIAQSGALSIGGTLLTLNPLTGTTPSGVVVLTAQAGDITETGSIRTGTLSGNATGSGTPATPPEGNANFAISSGNTVSTLTAFTASGNFALEDDTGLVVGGVTAGEGLAISGPTGLHALPSTGILILSGAVQGGGAVSLSNSQGIAQLASSTVTSTAGGVTLTSGGGIVQAQGATLGGGEAAASGNAVVFTAASNTDFDTTLPNQQFGTIRGISFGGQITAGTATATGYSGATFLTAAAGDVYEQTNGSILTGSLSGSATGSGQQGTLPVGNALFEVTSGNTVGVFGGFTASGGITLEDDTGVSAGGLTAGAQITINGPFGGQVIRSPTGILVLSGALQAGTDINLGNKLGIAQLAASSVTSTSGGVTLTTGGAFAQQAAASAGGNTPSITGTTLVITADGTTNFDTYIPAEKIGPIAGISFGGSLTAGTLSGGAYSGTATLTASAGDIVEGAQGSLRAGTLTGGATIGSDQTVPNTGSALFQVASGNVVSVVPSFTVSGNFALEDDAGLSLFALNPGGSIQVNGPTGPNAAAPTGPLVLNGALQAPGSITLSNGTGIAALSTASIASTSSSVSLASSGGAILQQNGATISGTTITLAAGGPTNFDNYPATNGLGSIDGISFAGQLIANTIALSSSQGNILELPTGALLGGTLTGGGITTGGNVELGIPSGNAVSVLGSFTATGSFALEDDENLTIDGPVTANGNIHIFGSTSNSATPSILVIAGTVSGGSVDLDNGFGILETGTGNVTGTAYVSLVSGGGIGQLAGGRLSVTDANGASGAGTLSLTAVSSTDFTAYGQASSIGTVQGLALGGTLVAGSAASTAGSFTGTANLVATAGDITETAPGGGITGIIQAGSLTASAGTASTFGTYGLSLDNGFGGTPANQIGTLFGLYADSAITVADDGSVFNSFGYHNVYLEGAHAAGGALNIDIYGANLNISGQVSAATTASFSAISGPSSNGGVLSGGINQFGGTIQAQTVTIDAGYDVSQVPGATIAANGGTNPAINITANGYSTVFVNNVSNTVEGIALGGTLTSGSLSGGIYSGSVSLTATEGNILEQGPVSSTATGVIQAGTLAATAQTGTLPAAGIVLLGTESSAATGNQIANLGVSSADAGFALVDGQALKVTGAVQAGLSATTPSSLTLYAPGIAVTTGSLAIVPPVATAPGVISLVADSFTFATSGDVTTPGGIVALDLLNASSGNTIFSVGSVAGDTVSVVSLQNIHTNGGTVALGSLDGTVASPGGSGPAGWAIGTGGTVTALDIASPIDLTGGNTASALGLFSNETIDASAGITVSALYGSAGGTAATQGSASITGANAIGTLGVLSASGSLVGFSTSNNASLATLPASFLLADTVPLTVLGPVDAEKGIVQISVSGTSIAGTPNGLTLGGTITAGGMLVGGNISGTDVFLDAPGTISQVAGTLTAFGASNVPADATNGTIVLNSASGGIALDGSLFGGSVSTLNGASAILLHAGGGDITQGLASSIGAGTLAALASGNISLASATNTISAIGPLGNTQEGLTLYGLTASGPTGITLHDTTSLQIADDTTDGFGTHATVSAYGPNGQTGPGTGSITVLLTNGSLTLGSSAGATVEALGGITLTAPGNVTQNNGSVTSYGGTVGVTSTGANVIQNGGSITSVTEDVDVSAWNNIQQNGALISAANNAVLTAGTSSTLGAIIQTDNSLVAAGNNVIATAYDGAGGIAISQSGSSTISALNNAVLKAIAGGLAQITSTILGNHGVSLDISGSVTTSAGSTIQSSGIANDATSGTIAIASSAGSIGISGLIEAAGTLLSNSFTPAASSAVLLSAGGGDVTEQATGVPDGQILAGTLAVAAAGNIALTGGTNQISAVGSLSSLNPALTLYGLSAHGTAGIALTDETSLTIEPDADSAHPVVQSFAAGAPLIIDETGVEVFFNHIFTYGSLTLGGTGPASLLADGNITLISTGDIIQASPLPGATPSVPGHVTSAHGSIAVTSTEGSFTQSNGSLTALAGDITVSTDAGVSQSGATIEAGHNIGIDTGGFVIQTSGSEIRADTGNVGIIAGDAALTPRLNLPGGDIDQTASRIDAGGNVSLSAEATYAGYGNIAQSGNSFITAGGSLSALSAGTVSQSASTLQAVQDITITAAGSITQIAGSEIQSTGGNIGLTAGATTLVPNLNLPGGDIDQTDSRVDAAKAITATAQGTQSGIGNITQIGNSAFAAGTNATLSAAGSIAFAGSITASSTGTVLLSAGGDITELDAAGTFTGMMTGGTLAALAGGSLALDGPNQVSTIAPIGTLTGLVATTGNIDFTDQTSLALVPGTAITASSGSIAIAVSGGAGALNLAATDATIQASSLITLSATGSLTQAGGLMQATQGNVYLSGGQFAQSGGGLIEASGDVNIASQADASFTDSTIQAGNIVTIGAGLGVGIAGNVFQTSTGTGTSDLISAGAKIDLGASDMVEQSAGSTLVSGSSIQLGGGGTVTLSGTVQAGTLAGGAYTGTLYLSSNTASIEASTGTLLTGSLIAEAANGAIDLSDPANRIAVIPDYPQAGIQAAGNIFVQDSQSLVVAGNVVGGGNVTFNVAGGDFTLSLNRGITAADALSITASGSIGLGGFLSGDTVALVAGGPVTETTGTSIAAQSGASIVSGGAITIDGFLASSGPVSLKAATDISEGPGGAITSGPATLAATSGAVTIDGSVKASGTLGITAGTGITEDPTASITAGATSLVANTGAITISGPLTATGALTILAGTDFSQTGPIFAGATSISAATGAVTLDGSLTASGPLAITAATDVTEGNTAIVAGPTSIIAKTGAVDIGGALTVNGGLAISAGTDFAEEAEPAPNAGASNTQPNVINVTGAATISAADSASVFGLLNASGALAITAGTDATLGGGITAGSADITAKAGSVGISGQLTSNGALTIAAGTDVVEQSPAYAIDGPSIAPGGSITIAGAGTITAGGAVTIGGRLADLGALSITAATSFNEGQYASITGAPITIAAAGGPAIFDGALTSTGPLGLSTGGDFIEDGGATIAASTTGAIAAKGAVTINGALKIAGGLGITAGTAFSEASTGSITGGAPTTIAAGSALTIGGQIVASQSLGLTAGTGFTENGSGSITAGPIAIDAKSGAATIDGALTSTGSLSLLSSTDLSQGAASTISAAGSTTMIAPGTITLAGTLAAPTIYLGEPATQLIVWNGNTVDTNSDIHGATNSVSIPAPLTSGQGVFLDSAAFQQTGTSSVNPLSDTAATMQVKIEGRGSAQFASLVAPKTQLLLVLEGGGNATGSIDVAGLNIYYTLGVTPLKPVSLLGTVGGDGGYGAAAVGFSHHVANINYQINGCPIESINCVLLSPLVVPVVDPVNDYAEGTQRKRRRDDDALPNVGEEDY